MIPINSNYLCLIFKYVFVVSAKFIFQDICCQCGEKLQNSEEPGIHLCDGGYEVILDGKGQVDSNTDKTNDDKSADEVDARLGECDSNSAINTFS